MRITFPRAQTLLYNRSRGPNPARRGPSDRDEPREKETQILERFTPHPDALLAIERTKPRENVKQIKNPTGLIAQLRRMPGIVAAAPEVTGEAIASYGTKTGYGANLQDALLNLDQSVVGEGISSPGTTTGKDGGSPSSSSPPPSTSSSSSPGTSSGGVTLQQLDQANDAFQAAISSGDQSKIYAAQAKLNELVAKYLSQHPPSTGSKSSASPSRSRWTPSRASR